MIIGNYYYILSEKKSVRFIYKLLGTIDLHSHIRLKPVFKFIKKFLSDKSSNDIKILELGCGSGVSAFEINKISNKNNFAFDYIGIDSAEELISISNKILKSINPLNNKITFIKDEAINFLKDNIKLKADVILLLDIIEHLNEPQILLYLSNQLLKNEGVFLVSVPTKLYPKYFGYKFHKEIGHQVDGYSLTELKEMFNKIGCELAFYKYNTGILGKYGCCLYYKIFYTNSRFLEILKWLILFPFKYFDLINNSKVSCSLFAVFKKK